MRWMLFPFNLKIHPEIFYPGICSAYWFQSHVCIFCYFVGVNSLNLPHTSTLVNGLLHFLQCVVTAPTDVIWTYCFQLNVCTQQTQTAWCKYSSRATLATVMNIRAMIAATPIIEISTCLIAVLHSGLSGLLQWKNWNVWLSWWICPGIFDCFCDTTVCPTLLRLYCGYLWSWGWIVTL